MRSLLLLSWLVPVVLSTTFGKDSAVITLSDVRNGLTTLTTLTPNRKYRVYATSAVSNTNQYTSNVVVKGSDNNQFTVSSLAVPKSSFLLSSTNILIAPITITDSNVFYNTPPSYPFTIYIVAEDLPIAPVISLSYAVSQPIYPSKAFEMTTQAVTVLSAEYAFLLRNFDVTNMAVSVDVKGVGYDACTDTPLYAMMTVTPQNYKGSVLTISGPIATLYSARSFSPEFHFELATSGVWNALTIPVGATTSLLSDGWLTENESYNVDYSYESALHREVDFDKELKLDLSFTLGNYDSSIKGNTIWLSCNKASGAEERIDGLDQSWYGHAICKSLVWNIIIDRTVAISAIKKPRFMLQIRSSENSTALAAQSFAVLLLVMCGLIQ